MNICFLSGKIVSEIKFEFIYNSRKNISVAKFKIETKNADNYKNNITNINYIYSYNEIADKIYANYEKGFRISISGYIENNKVIIKNIYE